MFAILDSLILVTVCEVLSDPNSKRWSVTVTWPENGEVGSLEILSARNNLYRNINTLSPPHLQQNIVHGRFLLLPLMLKFFLNLQAALAPLAENNLPVLIAYPNCFHGGGGDGDDNDHDEKYDFLPGCYGAKHS